MPAVTGRTRRRFAPALGSGKAAGRCKTACTTRKIRGGSLLYKAPHPVCLPHGFVQDEVILFIAQAKWEVKGEFLGGFIFRTRQIAQKTFHSPALPM